MADPTLPPDSNGHNILVVEDNMVSKTMLQLALRKAGYCVQHAENGQKCLEQLKKHSFDLVLMDIEMPVMKGDTALEHIRAGDSPQLPVVAMTAHHEVEELERLTSLGFDSVLTKPLDTSVLLQIIQNMLHQS